MAKKTDDTAASKQSEPSTMVGRVIKEVRRMKPSELAVEGWENDRRGSPAVLVLDDGSKVYPSRDSEGNGPGALFGADPDGKTFQLG